MKQLARLEDSLNGGYPGLYGEVVTCDTYRIRQLDFVPDLVFDIGANVGVFTRFARELFPSCRVISLEPHPANCAVFRQFTNDPQVTLIEKALGRGKLYHTLTAVNGSGENYLSAGLGYPAHLLDQQVAQRADMEFSGVETIRLHELISAYWDGKSKTLLKIDCEGAENTLWGDPLEMGTMYRMDYVCMEVHTYALTAAELPRVRAVEQQALDSFQHTHTCTRDGVHFWARKK